MHVAKVNGTFVLVNEAGRVFSAPDYSSFTRKLKEELDRAEIKTPAMGLRQESGGETSDEKGSSREP